MHTSGRCSGGIEGLVCRSRRELIRPYDAEPSPMSNILPVLASLLAESSLFGEFLYRLLHTVPCVDVGTWQGAHVILYTIFLYLLWSKRLRLQRTMLAGITVLFAMTIGDIGYTWSLVLSSRSAVAIDPDTHLLDFRTLYPKYIMFVSNNLIGTGLIVSASAVD